MEDSPEAYENFEEFLSNISPKIRKAYTEAYKICGDKVEICWQWLFAEVPEKSDMGRSLEKIGFRWGWKKKMFCFAGVPKTGNKSYHINQLRYKYNSITFKGKKEDEKRQLQIA